MNGLLDANGKLHKCEPYEHMYKAKEIVETMDTKVETAYDAELYLHEHGWVTVRTRDMYGLIGCFKEDGTRYRLTHAQTQWINENYENMTEACRESADRMLEFNE